MSKYGTIPASSSTPPVPPEEGSTAALDPTSCAEAPGASDAEAARCPWREFADPRALSVPRGFSDARRRARGNLARFAANYGLVYLVAVSVSLLWRPVYLPLVVACFFFVSPSPGKLFSLLSMFTSLAMVVTRATAPVLIVLLGLLLVAAHAVLHLPTDGGIDEEAGLCYHEPQPPTSTD